MVPQPDRALFELRRFDREREFELTKNSRARKRKEIDGELDKEGLSAARGAGSERGLAFGVLSILPGEAAGGCRSAGLLAFFFLYFPASRRALAAASDLTTAGIVREFNSPLADMRQAV